MNKKILIAVLAVAVLAVFYVWGAYNKLVSAREFVDNQWAQVQTQYQRRFDLIPNLVESTKGIMSQEQKVFGDLAEARTRYSGAVSVDDKVKAVSQVEGALARLLVVVENYPQLKSSENIRDLVAQLEGTENRVSVERQRFNNSVKDYNLAIKRFPSNLVASIFGFSAERPYFESTQGAETAPAVKF